MYKLREVEWDCQGEGIDLTCHAPEVVPRPVSHEPLCCIPHAHPSLVPHFMYTPHSSHALPLHASTPLLMHNYRIHALLSFTLIACMCPCHPPPHLQHSLTLILVTSLNFMTIEFLNPPVNKRELDQNMLLCHFCLLSHS